MPEEFTENQPQQNEVVDEHASAETEKTEEKQVDNKIPYERFKSKVDEANELKRELEQYKKERDEAERKKLEEQEEYKVLAEKYREEADAIRADALNAKKDALLSKAGYTDEQVERYRKYLEGNSDEEITEALEQLKADIPPKKNFVDPSAGNGGREKPKPTDLSDEGKTLYQRLKAKGKVR